MQLKREAKFLTVIGLTNMHAVCHITFMLYQIFLYRRMILRNLVLKLKPEMNSSHLFTRYSWRWIQRLHIHIGVTKQNMQNLVFFFVFFFWIWHFVAVAQQLLLHIDSLHPSDLCLSDSHSHICTCKQTRAYENSKKICMETHGNVHFNCAF